MRSAFVFALALSLFSCTVFAGHPKGNKGLIVTIGDKPRGDLNSLIVTISDQPRPEPNSMILTCGDRPRPGSKALKLSKGFMKDAFGLKTLPKGALMKKGAIRKLKVLNPAKLAGLGLKNLRKGSKVKMINLGNMKVRFSFGRKKVRAITVDVKDLMAKK